MNKKRGRPSKASLQIAEFHNEIQDAKTEEPVTPILQEAHGLIYGDREKDYGHPRENLEAIAGMWSAYISQKYGLCKSVTADDVCWMMTLLKMCRDMGSEKKRDTIVDAAGYVGLIGRLRDE